jgi:multiple sugar transport system substrate-binding protein
MLYIKVVLGFCVLLAVLSGGCQAGGERAAGEPVPVSMWMFGGSTEQNAWVRQEVEQFNAAQDEIALDFETRDWATQRESLITATIAGAGPDIIRVHHMYSVEFGELGGLYPLDGFADFPAAKERILDNLWEHVAYDGQHYGLPILILPFVLAVNKDLLNRNGLEIPLTWEDMMAMGPVLKEQDIYAFTMPAGANQDAAYRFLPMLYKAGGRVFNEDWTKAAFNGPAGLATLEYLVSMKEQGFMPPACAAYADDENMALWCTGKAALSIEGPWWQTVLEDRYGFPLEKMQLIKVPAPAQLPGPHPSRTLLDLVMVSITGYSQVPEEAWTVIKALWLDHPQWEAPDPLMGGFPALKVAYAPGVESDFIDGEVLAAAGQNGLAWPGHPAITQIQRSMADALNMAMSGTLSPKEALDQAAAEVDEILEDY